VLPSAAPAAISPWTILVLFQAPAIAMLIVLAFARPAAAEGIASTTFALALSAIWLGGSLAAWGFLAGPSPSGPVDSLEARILNSPGPRLATMGALCAIESAVLLAVVYLGSGLKGSWPSMCGVVLLASAVGLSLGWAVFSLTRSPSVAVPVLVLGFLAMVALGGRIWPLPPSSLGAGIATAMPSRWAFEGLMLLEIEGRTPTLGPDSKEGDRPADLAEGFFPADTERMGPKADAMALGFMLIGLAGAAAFLSASGNVARREAA
jgi:hypothetical protein